MLDTFRTSLAAPGIGVILLVTLFLTYQYGLAIRGSGYGIVSTHSPLELPSLALPDCSLTFSVPSNGTMLGTDIVIVGIPSAHCVMALLRHVGSQCQSTFPAPKYGPSVSGYGGPTYNVRCPVSLSLPCGGPMCV